MKDSWFFRRDDGEQQGPLSTDEIRSMLDRGELEPGDWVWSEGMADWRRVDQVPELGPAPAGSPPSADTPIAPIGAAPAGTAGTRVALPPGLLGWMSFLSIVTIIGGAFSVLSCFGLPAGILTIIAGVSLYGARTALEALGQADAELEPFLGKLKMFMLMQGIAIIVNFVLMALGIILYFGVIMAALAGAGEF